MSSWKATASLEIHRKLVRTLAKEALRKSTVRSNWCKCVETEIKVLKVITFRDMKDENVLLRLSKFFYESRALEPRGSVSQNGHLTSNVL